MKIGIYMNIKQDFDFLKQNERKERSKRTKTSKYQDGVEKYHKSK
jgi:hypothetical protein